MKHFLNRIRRRLRYYLWRWRVKREPSAVGAFVLDPGSGLQIRYPLKTGIGQLLWLGGFEQAELDYVRKHLKPGQTFLDVGANGGIYSLTAAQCVGTAGRVIAFEPGNAEQKLIEDNLTLNHVTTVRLVKAAVSNANGTARLAVAEDGALNSLAVTDRSDQVIKQWQETPTIRLDDFLETEGINQVDFVKIDVEGAEWLVLDGARRLFSKAAPLTVLFEAYDPNSKGFGANTADVLNYFLELGYRLSYFAKDGGLIPFSTVLPEFGTHYYNFVAQR